jgi:AcrR family transcriptional regulator
MMSLVATRASSSPARPSRDEKKAMTRQRLLDAAAIVFGRKGVAAASLDDVAEVAGLTKGAVYSNFASKEDLIFAVLQQRLGEPSDAIAPGINESLPQDEQASIAGQQFMHLVDTQRDAYLLELEFLLYLARNPDKGNPTRFNERVRAVAQVMEERAAETGIALPLPAEELTVGVFALGTGLALERLVNPDRVSPDLFGKLLGLIFGTPLADAGPAQPKGRGKTKR